MQQTNQPRVVSPLKKDAIDHHLWNHRGRWFLNYRFLGRPPSGDRAFTKVHLATYDLVTARERRDVFINHLFLDHGQEVAA